MFSVCSVGEKKEGENKVAHTWDDFSFLKKWLHKYFPARTASFEMSEMWQRNM